MPFWIKSHQAICTSFIKQNNCDTGNISVPWTLLLARVVSWVATEAGGTHFVFAKTDFFWPNTCIFGPKMSKHVKMPSTILRHSAGIALVLDCL